MRDLLLKTDYALFVKSLLLAQEKLMGLPH